MNGTELSFLPIGIDYDFIGAQVDGFCNGFGMAAEHHTARADFRMARNVNQMLQERTALEGQKSLGGAHALRNPAGEDDSGKHENSGSYLVSTGSVTAILSFL